MAHVTANRSGFGPHGHGLQPHAGISPKVGDKHLVVGAIRPVVVKVKRVAIFHQELAAAHNAETRPNLVPELPLNVIEQLRQVAITLD